MRQAMTGMLGGANRAPAPPATRRQDTGNAGWVKRPSSNRGHLAPAEWSPLSGGSIAAIVMSRAGFTACTVMAERTSAGCGRGASII